jgi:hypothetical protein
MIIVTQALPDIFFASASTPVEALYPHGEPARSNGGPIDSASTKSDYAGIGLPVAIALNLSFAL